MKAPAFDCVRAASLPQVFELMRQHGDDARLLADGQTLMATLNMRLSEPALLIDIGELGALRGISLACGLLRIGALSSYAESEGSVLVAQHAPLLAQAAPHIAHAAIRNRGTLGGSLAYADPAAEWPACVLALHASVVLASAKGERRLPASRFFIDLYSTAIAADELIVAVELPLLADGERQAFDELARRHGDYAIVGPAARALQHGGKLHQIRLAFLVLEDRPVRAPRTEALLQGQAPDDSTLALQSLKAELQPAGDLTHRPPPNNTWPACRLTVKPPKATRSTDHPRCSIRVEVNGTLIARSIEPRRHLVDFLREDHGLKGSHLGCEHGVCGVCSVRLDGQLVRGCLVLAVQADGRRVETIETPSPSPRLRVLREAFVARNALQCGCCTGGMLMAALELVEREREPDADRDAVRLGISGNCCRCTGYHGIVDAVCDVLAAQRDGAFAAAPQEAA